MRRPLPVALPTSVLACLLSGLLGCQRQPAPAPGPPPGPPAPKATVVKVYFADPQTALLRPVERTVQGQNLAEGALTALLAGPQPDEKLDLPLPKGTTLLGVSVDNGLATVDLSKEYQEGFPQGGAAQTLALYALVNTLTDLPGVRAVDILIEGKPVETLGELSVAEPITRSEDFVVR